MAFAWTRSESRPWIASARTTDANPVDSERAATLLRDDYERWSRWGLGLLGFAFAVVGIFVTVGMVDSIRALSAASLADILVVAGAVIAAAIGAAILIALWTTGRRLLVAAQAEALSLAALLIGLISLPSALGQFGVSSASYEV